MGVKANIVSKLSVTEDITAPFEDPINNTILHDGLDESFTLSATSTPPAAKVAPFRQALTSGAATIDLTNLPGTNGASVNGTALKVRACKFRNPAYNSHAITITVGATNGYPLLGSGFCMTLLPGQSSGPLYLADGAPAIDSTHKTLDLTGTGSESLDVGILLG